MKKIILFLLLLISFSVFSQNPDRFRNGIRTQFVQPDTLSTANRDALTPKLGTIIFHKDTGFSRWEQWDGSDWVAFGGASSFASLLGNARDNTDLSNELDLALHKTGNEIALGSKTFQDRYLSMKGTDSDNLMGYVFRDYSNSAILGSFTYQGIAFPGIHMINNVSSEQISIGNDGSLFMSPLQGTGTRMVVAQETGIITTQSIPVSGIAHDVVPTDGSTNGVESNGVFDALALKFPYTGGIITGTTNIQLTDYDYRLGPSGFQLKANALSSPNNGYFTIRRFPSSNNYDIVTPSGVASTGSSKLEFITVNNTVDTGDPTAVVAIVKGRMKGEDGIDSDDYATVGQISGGGTGNYKFTTKSGNETLDSTIVKSATSGRFDKMWRTYTANDTITVPGNLPVGWSSVIEAGSAVDSILIKADTGVDIYGRGNVLVKSGDGIDGLWLKGGDAAALIYKGTNSVRAEGPWNVATLAPTNLYNTANAASPIAEANSTTGVTGSAGVTITSVASPKTNGSYAIQAVTPATSGDHWVYFTRPSGLTAGTYTITFDVSTTNTSSGKSVSLHDADQWAVYQETAFSIGSGTSNFQTVSITGTLSSISNADSGRLKMYIGNNTAVSQTWIFDNIIWTED